MAIQRHFTAKYILRFLLRHFQQLYERGCDSRKKLRERSAAFRGITISLREGAAL
jgi:hypothetical protein